ncbi:MAG: peptidoglycan DD-metalloendopeptidase family protein, partial [Alphaproteobacteria bacterium]|nr:peptidoglycan DD-metalloendopeptidase family protein [Alphaproteobacteria bacterium]
RAALGEARSALDSREGERRDIEGQLTTLRSEVVSLKSELVAAAADAQALEDQLGNTETELEGLEQSREARRAALAERRFALGRSIAALQRLARTPPEALFAMPTSLREAHNTTILIGAVVRELDLEAQFLRAELADLDRLEKAIESQRAETQVASRALQAQQVRLVRLVERKALLQAETAAEYSEAGDEINELVARAGSLQELVEVLGNVQAKERAALAQQNQMDNVRETTAALGNSDDRAAEVTEVPSSTETAPEALAPVAAVEMPAENAAKNTGAAEQSIAKPDEAARGEVVLVAIPQRPEIKDIRSARGYFIIPARGNLVQRFAENTSSGLAAKGISIETRLGAQVVAPFGGKIAFAGPFRNYGQILIIAHGEGYHTLLAGLGHIHARLGQKVLAGEPLGIMAADGGARPRLYVELRKKGHPINPLPWLAAEGGATRG